MKLLSLFIATFFLSSCALFKPGETRYFPVYCVTADQYRQLVDAQPKKVGDRLTGQAQDDFKIVAGSAIALRVYSDGLLEVIGNCVGPTPAATLGDTHGLPDNDAEPTR